jgi:hypothetical protein
VGAPRLLPELDVLVKLRKRGLTHAEIADEVERMTGHKVSRSTVSAALSRAGETDRTNPRYSDELPWRVKPQHLTQYQARMLRLLGRRRSGMELTEDQAARLDSWMSALDENGWVAAYCPDGPGFIYVQADEFGDWDDDIPIRRRTISPDELA